MRFKVNNIIYQNKPLILLMVLLGSAVMSSASVIQKEREVESLREVKVQKEREVKKLAELMFQYPDYRDLLIRLAVRQWELGNLGAVEEAVERARYLDPNSEKLKQFQWLISKNP